MGVLNFLLKSKLKKTINEYMINAKMDRTKINLLFNDSIMQFNIDYLASGSDSMLPIQQRLEHTMVVIAENYMEQLLDYDTNGIISEIDFAKLHFCIAIMISVASDRWLSIDAKILRLDLWYIHWKQINSVGERIIQQSSKKTPFIATLYFMMSMNIENGLLYLPQHFPFEIIVKMINDEYLDVI